MRARLRSLTQKPRATLVRGLAPPNPHSCARTRKASQGRKPKIKTPLELSTPIFVYNKIGRLRMNINLNLVAETHGLAERLA